MFDFFFFSLLLQPAARFQDETHQMILDDLRIDCFIRRFVKIKKRNPNIVQNYFRM